MTKNSAVSRYKRMTDNIDHRLVIEQRQSWNAGTNFFYVCKCLLRGIVFVACCCRCLL
jgi:hypothetical protein